VALRVLIVDDNESYLDSACALLASQGMEVVGVASSPADGLQRARDLAPDVVVVDLHLGSASGLHLARRLAADASPPAVVLVSSIGYDDLAALAEGAPVRGYLTKTDLSAAAIESILTSHPGL
jgi:DNA-binding NarL/FixJ family response regulator